MSEKKFKLSKRMEGNMAKKPTDLFGRKGPVSQQAGPPQQVNINISPNDITFKPCEQCGHEFFDAAFRRGIMSSLNAKNPTGKDMLVQVPILLCRSCGWEVGLEVKKKQ